MIDFRYHLVSIVAVFLALAIGVVLGSATLRGPLVQQVHDVAADLRASNGDLRQQVATLRHQVDADQKFAGRLAPQAVNGALSGKRVVLVSAPGASDQLRAKTKKMLGRAGATVTGRVSVKSKYLDGSEQGVIGELAGRLKPKDLSLPDGTAYQRAGAVLADALVTGGSTSEQGSGKGSGDAASETVLSAFETAGYISRDGNPRGGATLAVVLAPKRPFDGKDAESDNGALVALARALDKHDQGTVLAGPRSSATDGGLVHALRGGGAAKTVSTVDYAGVTTGRVATVLALRTESQDKTGHYGVGARAQRYLPLEEKNQ